MDHTRIGMYAFPAFLALIALEAWWYARARNAGYPWAESAASLGMAVGYRLIGIATPLVVGGVYLWVWDRRLWTVPMDAWWSWPLLFVLFEFTYYWFHRFSHECRWLWATHAPHHSPTHLTFSAAYRLGWTGLVSGTWLFWLPLMTLGFPPWAVVLMLGANLTYQFWLHTEMIGRLGPLEAVLNTPSHHRVHHSTNDGYLDRNYGGVVIFWDRLFGTFAAEREDEPCRYGLVHPIESNNPFVLAFTEWVRLCRDVWRARTWRARLGHAFGRPGWHAGKERPALGAGIQQA